MSTSTFVDGFGNRFLPDVKITVPKSSYTYIPCRGYGASVAVLDDNGFNRYFIGFMTVDNLPDGPFADVRDWIQKTGYQVKG